MKLHPGGSQPPTLRLARALALVTALTFVSGQSRAADASPDTRPRQDARGNPLRYARTGHVSNYDEAKVGDYRLPDPLVLRNGRPVRDADTWWNARRPEIVALYESEIYGRVPANAPRVTFDVVETGTPVLGGAALRRHVVLRFGDAADGPKANLVLYLPARGNGPAPVLLQMVFFSGLPAAVPPGAPPAKAQRFTETGPVEDILARGYAYATLRYTEIEGDRADTNLTGVRKLALATGQEKPAPDEWGSIAA